MIKQEDIKNAGNDVFAPFETALKEKSLLPILPHLILISVVVGVIYLFRVPIWKGAKKTTRNVYRRQRKRFTKRRR